MVSIGPYYYNLRNNQNFKMAEDCKRNCFGSWLFTATFLDGEFPIMDIYETCLKCIREVERDIRNCYSECIKVSGFEFHEMIVLDACFIIEIINTFGPRRKVYSNKFYALEWMVPYFSRIFSTLIIRFPFWFWKRYVQLPVH